MAGDVGAQPLTRMREALRPHHDRIEAELDLMSPSIDRARYERFLERSLGFISACERRLDVAAAPPALQIETRLKTELLRSDLEQLGRSAAQLDAVPAPARVPAVESWPSALGYLYVIEGSTLGGQILARHMKATLGLPDEVTRFLRSDRRNVGAQWKEMLAVLTAAMADPEAEQRITGSAAETFTLLREWHQA